jgi:glycosyltransferase involved in cell wall biosynthesis
VVDNYSEDKTKEYALAFTDLVFNKGPERNAQRNFGMLDVASGQYLMWIDADMILSPTLIFDCYKLIIETDFVALYIPEVIIGCKFWSRARRFERGFYDNTVIDGTRFISADAFFEAGGFSSDWLHGPDDWDLDKSLKAIGPLGYLDLRVSSSKWGVEREYLHAHCVEPANYGSVIFHDEGDFSLKHYLRKKKHYATDFQGYRDKWGSDDPDVRKQVGIAYRYFIVFFEQNKWRRCIRHPILFFATWLLRILVGIVYMKEKWSQ